MGIFHFFRLYIECFKLAGVAGLISCSKYLCGVLDVDEIPVKSSEFAGDVIYE